MGQSKTDLLERFAARAEDRPLLGRLLDLSEAADRRGRAQPSRFLDARQQGLAAALLNAAGRPYLLWGGYEEAERRVVCCCPIRLSRRSGMPRRQGSPYCGPIRLPGGFPTGIIWGL